MTARGRTCLGSLHGMQSMGEWRRFLIHSTLLFLMSHTIHLRDDFRICGEVLRALPDIRACDPESSEYPQGETRGKFRDARERELVEESYDAADALSFKGRLTLHDRSNQGASRFPHPALSISLIRLLLPHIARDEMPWVIYCRLSQSPGFLFCTISPRQRVIICALLLDCRGDHGRAR